MTKEYMRLVEAQKAVLLSASAFKSGVDAALVDVSTRLDHDDEIACKNMSLKLSELSREALTMQLDSIKSLRQSGAPFYDVVKSANLATKVSMAINDISQSSNEDLAVIEKSESYHELAQSMRDLYENMEELRGQNLKHNDVEAANDNVVQVDFAR